MDYERKYLVALKRANIIYTGKYKPEIAAWTKKSLEAIFPELKESEEEQVGVMETPSKTFPKPNLFEDGTSCKH